MFEDIITVYHYESEAYTRQVLENVYFKRSNNMSINSNGTSKNGSGIIRIPTTNNINISNGDYVVYGRITADFNINDLLKNYDVYKVVNITNNIRGGLKHYKLEVSL